MKNNKKSKKVTNNKNQSKENRIKINFISKRCLELTIYISLIVLISLVSFFGVYTKSKNTTINKVKKYALGPDLDGYRNIVIKVEDSTTEQNDNEEETEILAEEDIVVEPEIPENAESEEIKEEESSSEDTVPNDMYDKAKRIIEDRLKYMKLDYYEIKCNKEDGTILIKVPNDERADYVSQYAAAKGEFKISDNDTKEVFIDNNNIKDVRVGYSTATAGTTIYLDIRFDKKGKEKLKEISNIYRAIENEETVAESADEEDEISAEELDNEEIENTENEEIENTENEEKQITLTLDDTTIITTSFEEEIDDGAIQLTLGTSSDRDTIQDHVEQATNIAVLLNSDAMPTTYKLTVNELVYTEMANPELLTAIIVFLIICYLVILISLIVKYGRTGILGAIASVGFIAILLLTIRYANVELTFSGLFAIFGAAFLENLLLNAVFTTYLKETDKETKDKEMRKTLIREYEYLLPIAIISIVFAITKWKPITSVGMILFWAILEMLIFNFINIKIICRKEEK